MISMDHEGWMRRALALARQGEGMTRPNPCVGAVVVKAGHSVGEGYHRQAGGPHAEVEAIGLAGAKARGATLYVTLEPCSTSGRTPPCSDLILNAGIRHVVLSALDPNPAHAGRALNILREAGVTVTENILRAEGEALIRPFACWILNNRPLVTLKLGMTLDGKIADARGKSQWITGPEAREEVQALRRRVDAVMVGAGTVRADDPSLWPRPDHGRTPWRVILTGKQRIPAKAKVLTDEQANHTLLLVGKDVPEEEVRRSYERKGALVERVATDKAGRPRINAVLKALAKRSIMHVLCEGGGQVAASLIRAEKVDEFLFFVAPRIMGGTDSHSAVGGVGWKMDHLPELTIVEHRKVGEDLLIRAVPKWKG